MMDASDGGRWRRVQELFEAVADMAPSDQASHLDAAGAGAAELRQEVEALLRSDAAAGSFIEHAIRRGSELLLVAEPDPLESIGKVGKYEILGRIGEGGFGVVYKGRDPVLQRYVAVKTCSSRDEKLRRRFFREGQIAAGLQHPNITTVHDLGVERGIPYLVQEFLDGEDLNYKVARQEALTPLQRLDVLAQVARGLEYAHLQGVLHRDVKPANIRILPGGAVKIMDFGIAKLLHEVSDVTTQGMTLGTVGYLAPEQLRGEEVDRRTDIFAFGVLVYELLSYQRPFKGSTFSEVSYRLLNEEPRPLRELAPSYGPRLAELAARCLAKQPAERYDGFEEIIAALDREIEALRSGSFVVPAPGAGAAASAAAGALPQPPTIVEALPPGAAPPPGGRRHPPAIGKAAVAVVVLAVLAAAIAGGWGWVLLSRPPQTPQGVVGLANGRGGRQARPLRTAERRPGPPPPAAMQLAAPAPPSRLESGRLGRLALAQGQHDPQADHPEASAAPPAGSRRPASVEAPASRPATGLAAERGAAPADTASTSRGSTVEGPAAGAPPAPAADRGDPAAAASQGGAGGPPPAGSPDDELAGRGTAREGASGEDPAAEPSRPMRRGDLIPPEAPGAAPPRLVKRPEPTYPDRARRRRVEADVLMLVLVDENGRVVRAIVKRTDDHALGFNEAARQAALRATFAPATRDGLAGKMWTELPFSFRLHE
jgi:TonB family protein